MASLAFFYIVQWSSQRRKILEEWENHWTLERAPFQKVNLQGHSSGNIHGVTRNLTVTLERMHVSKVNTCSRHLHGRQDDRSWPDRINVHMPIGSEFQLLGANRVFVRSAPQRA